MLIAKIVAAAVLVVVLLEGVSLARGTNGGVANQVMKDLHLR